MHDEDLGRSDRGYGFEPLFGASLGSDLTVRMYKLRMYLCVWLWVNYSLWFSCKKPRECWCKDWNLLDQEVPGDAIALSPPVFPLSGNRHRIRAPSSQVVSHFQCCLIMCKWILKFPLLFADLWMWTLTECLLAKLSKDEWTFAVVSGNLPFICLMPFIFFLTQVSMNRRRN